MIAAVKGFTHIIQYLEQTLYNIGSVFALWCWIATDKVLGQLKHYYKTFQEHFRNFILPSASMLLPPKERARLVPVIIPQPLREEEGFVQFLL